MNRYEHEQVQQNNSHKTFGRKLKMHVVDRDTMYDVVLVICLIALLTFASVYIMSGYSRKRNVPFVKGRDYLLSLHNPSSPGQSVTRTFAGTDFAGTPALETIFTYDSVKKALVVPSAFDNFDDFGIVELVVKDSSENKTYKYRNTYVSRLRDSTEDMPIYLFYIYR